MTLDNASVNIAIIILIKLKLGAQKSELLHQRCMYYIINLIVKSGEKIVYKNIKNKNIKDTIQFLKSSNDRIESFRRFCKGHNQSKRLFVLDMPIR